MTLTDKEKIKEALKEIDSATSCHTITCVNCVENRKILEDLKKLLKS